MSKTSSVDTNPLCAPPIYTTCESLVTMDQSQLIVSLPIQMRMAVAFGSIITRLYTGCIFSFLGKPWALSEGLVVLHTLNSDLSNTFGSDFTLPCPFRANLVQVSEDFVTSRL